MTKDAPRLLNQTSEQKARTILTSAIIERPQNETAKFFDIWVSLYVERGKSL